MENAQVRKRCAQLIRQFLCRHAEQVFEHGIEIRLKVHLLVIERTLTIDVSLYHAIVHLQALPHGRH